MVLKYKAKKIPLIHDLKKSSTFESKLYQNVYYVVFLGIVATYNGLGYLFVSIFLRVIFGLLNYLVALDWGFIKCLDWYLAPIIVAPFVEEVSKAALVRTLINQNKRAQSSKILRNTIAIQVGMRFNFIESFFNMWKFFLISSIILAGIPLPTTDLLKFLLAYVISTLKYSLGHVPFDLSKEEYLKTIPWKSIWVHHLHNFSIAVVSIMAILSTSKYAIPFGMLLSLVLAELNFLVVFTTMFINQYNTLLTTYYKFFDLEEIYYSTIDLPEHLNLQEVYDKFYA